MIRRIVVIGVVALGIAAAAFFVPRPDGEAGAGRHYGYVEAEPLLVAPEAAGRIVELPVGRGDVVVTGGRLFALDDRAEHATLREAEARLARAEADLADLTRSQQRPEQIEVLEANRRRARAALELSRAELDRQQALYARGTIAEARLDQARTAFERDEAELAATEREIEVARLAGREAEIEAARADLAAAAAGVERARIVLGYRVVATPAAGRVTDIFYRRGEVVAAGQPVLEILPMENIRVRFYLPEPLLSRVRIGQRVAIACDGCPPDLAGEITFISPEAEFTPPVIFSREERAKLVFLVEAQPVESRPVEAGAALKPGLPVEVSLAGRGIEP